MSALSEVVLLKVREDGTWREMFIPTSMVTRYSLSPIEPVDVPWAERTSPVVYIHMIDGALIICDAGSSMRLARRLGFLAHDMLTDEPPFSYDVTGLNGDVTADFMPGGF